MAFTPLLTPYRFQDQTLLRFGTDDNALILAPAHGGRLVRWICDGQDILYWPDNADWAHAAKVRGGNPLLFPFIARHLVDGKPGHWRDAGGVVRQLPHHGFARDLPFTAEQEGDDTIAMTLRASPATHDCYPWDFTFTVRYRLLPGALEVSLQTSNASASAMPYYAGHHFYFSVPHAMRGDCRLELPAASRYRQQADGTPGPASPEVQACVLSDPALQDTFHVLQSRQPATLHFPQGQALRIDLDLPGTAPWYAVTTWSEREDADFYCIEPWLGLPDAIHHQQGLRWLAPGQQEEARCRLNVLR